MIRCHLLINWSAKLKIYQRYVRRFDNASIPVPRSFILLACLLVIFSKNNDMVEAIRVWKLKKTLDKDIFDVEMSQMRSL